MAGRITKQELSPNLIKEIMPKIITISETKPLDTNSLWAQTYNIKGEEVLVKGNKELLETFVKNFSSNVKGKGASRIGIHDENNFYNSTDVEGALAEVVFSNKALDTTGTATAFTTTTEMLLIDKKTYTIIPHINNTGSLTINNKNIKKYSGTDYRNLEAGDIQKNIPIQLLWDASQDFFVFAPKTGAKANYDKLGYSQPFQVILDDGLSENNGMNYIYYPQYTDMLIRGDGINITMPFYSIPTQQTSQRNTGIATYNIETNRYTINNVKTFTSGNRIISTKKELSGGNIIIQNVSDYTIESVNRQGRVVGQTSYRTNNIYNPYGSHVMATIGNNAFYVGSDTNHTIMKVSANGAINPSVQTVSKLNGQNTTACLGFGTDMYIFATNSARYLVYDCSNIDTPVYKTSGDWFGNFRTATGSGAQTMWADTDGTYIYSLVYNGSNSADCWVVKFDSNMRVIASYNLSQKLAGSYSSRIKFDGDNNIYVTGEAYFNTRNSIERYNRMSPAMYKFDKNLKLISKITSGMSGDIGHCKMDAKNGIAVFNRQVNRNDQYYYRRTPIVATMDDIISKKDLIKQLQK